MINGETNWEVVNRLKRIEGQVEGIQRRGGERKGLRVASAME